MYATLIKLGCRPSLAGFKYIEHAVRYLEEHPDTWVGEIYNDIAKKYKSNYRRVERCIRHCVQTASLQGDLKLWHTIFGNVIHIDSGCVTNKEFIWTLVEYFKHTSGSEKYWIATLTEDCGATTWTMKVTGATYTNALMNVVMKLDKDYIIGDHKKAIMDLQPLNFKV